MLFRARISFVVVLATEAVVSADWLTAPTHAILLKGFDATMFGVRVLVYAWAIDRSAGRSLVSTI